MEKVKKGQQKQWVSVDEMVDEKNFEGGGVGQVVGVWLVGGGLACDIPRERGTTPLHSWG